MSRLILRRKAKAKLMAKPQRNPPAPVADDKPTSAVQPPAGPPDPWEVIEGWVWKRFGVVGVVMLAVFGLVWTQWDHVKQLPGIESLVTRISEKPLPKTETGRFNIAIAHLAGDDDHAIEQVIRTSLVDQFLVANTRSFDRLILTEQGEREGHERARALLKASGFDVMVWGESLKKDGQSLPGFTSAFRGTRGRRSGRGNHRLRLSALPDAYCKTVLAP